jgi:Zn-dependent M28 family amino/carboxypeptidase
MRFVMPFAFAAAVLAIPAMAASYPPHPKTTPAITASDLSIRDHAVADDSFKGRGPGTKDGEMAALWIANEMKRIGLKPGNNGSYFQNVPAVTITLAAPKSSFSFDTKKGALAPKFGDEAVYWTPQFASDAVKVDKSQLVYVGYGVVAPEYNWNDYAGVDVKGKTVVILINDPGNEAAQPDPKFFKGKAMTWYGRWVYKYEEAARQGAAAAIIVHETIPAAYGWQVVRNSNAGPKSWLDEKDQNASMVPIQGWISLDTAKDLFKRAGLDYEKQKAAANRQGFKAIEMKGETLTADAYSSVTHMMTRNVIGVVKGTKHPDDYVLFTAHWDHFGVKDDVPGADKIMNGAVDNGMGTSSILELAEAFAHAKPERSMAFISVTLEEQGLLGSQYFAEHPLWPLNHMVGGINIDAALPEGKAHDMVLVGTGNSEMEDILAAELKTHDRTLTPDPEPEKGHFFRSDHFPLAKVGVPMISPGGGYDLINGGKEAGQAMRDDYRKNRYHQPNDEWSASWDLSGPVDDLQVFYAVGLKLANSNAWPNWYKDSEFRATRDKSMGGK